jgi:hypothetical protein
MYFLKRVAVFAGLGAIFYFLLSYHIIIIGNSFKLLKKSTLTLSYTIYSTKGKSLDSILTNEDLWYDGIGEMYLKMGKINQDTYDLYKEKMEGED